MTHNTWDAIIIGGGSAGLSAAQALGRSLRRTLVIDAGKPRNRFASHMHNALGLDGTPPLELIARGRDEAARYGVEFRAEAVREVRNGPASPVAPADSAGAAAADSAAATPTAPAAPGASASAASPAAPPAPAPLSQAPSRTVEVVLASGDTVSARALIVATGVTDVLPEIPGLAEHWGTSVMHCPYCHGWEVRGKRLAVLTTGPLGMHQAKLLRQWTDDLTVFTADLGTLDASAEREFAARNVTLVLEPVTEVVGSEFGVSAVRTADGATHDIDAIFTMSTMVPQDAFLAGLDLDRADNIMGSFITVDAMQRTSHPRIWAAGNVVAPGASVPLASGAANFAGAAANAALVEEDFELAAAASEEDAPAAAAQVGVSA